MVAPEPSVDLGQALLPPPDRPREPPAAGHVVDRGGIEIPLHRRDLLGQFRALLLTFGRVVDSVKAQIPQEVRPDMLLSIRELCEPDPVLRGHPLNRLGHGDQFSLERYISRFDLLARRAELGLLRK